MSGWFYVYFVGVHVLMLATVDEHYIFFFFLLMWSCLELLFSCLNAISVCCLSFYKF